MSGQEAIVQCDKQLYDELSAALHNGLVGKPIFYSDTLEDLVNRNCSDLYRMAADKGFKFVPSKDKDLLMKRPPDLRFAVLKAN